MTRCRQFLLALLLAGLRLNMAGAQTPQPPAKIPAQLLAYNAAAPLGVTRLSRQREGGVVVEDIRFASVAGNPPIAAYVVRPDTSAGPLAGVLFVHWFEPSSPTSNRTQFLDEARALARRGTVAVLVSTFWSDTVRYRSRRWQDDYRNTIRQGQDLRRALDVLLAQPQVDAKRIGYVGHDYGAMFGALVAGADPRIKAGVFIAGTARFADWYLFGSASGRPTGAALPAFKSQLAPLDPIQALKHTKAALFFQFGELDGYTPRPDFLALYQAAPSPKRIATYPARHAMALPIIRYDRTDWLAEQLGLPAPR
ncbi:Alpha/beta hydrolase family protein [Hymenobacter daecheongensis DSM 21074]|uniref:Alpha/beta hydrolase family protein n=1 Tax=Hymenobacter daecheongensis DSM 21074 TaxID=1121955 RepID=A0A1M6KPP2_9BACT|nr:prolyl oligopeptidase family serine peptidase [Hymenobacter daecheongensis]SHJ60910.1 Alpha/beta hydrolase family protein [Hymenobacter daecheongensis DSM 21074]